MVCFVSVATIDLKASGVLEGRSHTVVLGLRPCQ